MSTDTPIFKPGDTVIHARRGEGTVHTVAIHPITKRASKITVHFRRGADIQPVVCWPDDLTRQAPASPTLPPSPMRPTLTVVPGPAVA